MDEFNLANVFLDHDGIQENVVDLNGFQKIPFAELAGFGGIIAELIPCFRKAKPPGPGSAGRTAGA